MRSVPVRETRLQVVTMFEPVGQFSAQISRGQIVGTAAPACDAARDMVDVMGGDGMNGDGRYPLWLGMLIAVSLSMLMWAAIFAIGYGFVAGE